MNRDKKLLIHLMIMQKLDLKPFSNPKNKNKTTETRLKLLSPKQMLQTLPIALAQVKAGNNSESLLNEIRQIVYISYQSKQIIKKVYNNIIKSMQ